jgi:predicted SnoaL-like aldol condensation-catalyzing enzyme
MSRTPEEQAALDFCTRMYHECLFRFDATKIDEFLADGYIQHSTAASEGKEGLRAFFLNRGDRFPQIRFAIKASMVDGDMTMFHIHTVRFPGDPGMSIVDYFRLEGGKVKEHWEVVQEIPETLPHGNGVF